MKIKENFVLRQIAGQYVVVAIAQASVDFNGMITLNESSALLWAKLEQGCDRAELIRALTEEYEVSEEKAAQDIDQFLAKLVSAGCLDD